MLINEQILNRGNLEICVDSLESAIAAQAGGASRIELCGDLSAEGTTPSAGMIALARRELQIVLHVMIRPRGGDFCYSDLEFEAMENDVVVAKRLGADGVVFGLLTPERHVDVQRTKILVDLARPMKMTFHRAFDIVAEPLSALDTIMSLGIERILSSGQKPTAMEGLPLLRKLVAAGNGKVSIMPASGITLNNIQTILHESGATEVHIGKAVTREIRYPDATLFDAKRSVVESDKVQEFVKVLNKR